MAKLFDYNNPVWRFMGKIADFFMLTMVWAVCSIPIVTIGASTSALYYVVLKMVKNHEQYIIRSFFHYMKENFVSSTVVWIMVLAMGFIPAAGFFMLNQMGIREASFIFWMLAVITLIYFMFVTILFPLSARLDANALKLLMMSFMVSLKHFAWVFFMIVVTVCVAALGIFVFWPVLLIGIAGIAYVHALILEFIIFPKYNWNEPKERN